MTEKNSQHHRTEQLTPVEKAFFAGGAAIGFAARLVESALTEAGKIFDDSVKAFRQGIDPNIDEAKILEEINDDRPSSDEPSPKG